MPMIEIKNMGVIYGSTGKNAVEGFTMKANHKEFLCILGPSGCGKTTILNAIAGFVTPAMGSIFLNHKSVTGPHTDSVLVFQDHALFPWKTAAENIAFAPKMHGVPKCEIQRKVGSLIKIMRLQGCEHAYPRELSGGMQQRVGIARALAANPKVLLMDEPFGSLDAQTRMQMQELLLSIWQKHQKTIVFVTHDIEEAIFLADRIILLTKSPGRVKKEIAVNLPRPRTRRITTTKQFTRLKGQILGLLEEGMR